MNATETSTEQYRGFSIARAPMGHWNVSKGGGFCGGFSSLRDAKDWVDNRFWSVERVEMKDGRIGYRVLKIAVVGIPTNRARNDR